MAYLGPYIYHTVGLSKNQLPIAIFVAEYVKADPQIQETFNFSKRMGFFI